MSIFGSFFMNDRGYILTAGPETQLSTNIHAPVDTLASPAVVLDTTKSVTFYAVGSTLYGYVQDINLSASTITNNAAGEQNLSPFSSSYLNATSIGNSTQALVTGRTNAATTGSVKLITESAGTLSVSATGTFGTTVTNPWLANLDASYSVVFWAEGSTDTRAAIVDNTTAVVGTPTSIVGSIGTATMIGLDSTHFICGYTVLNGSDFDLYVIVGVRSGTTITFGTPVLVAATIDSGYLAYHSATQAAIYYKYDSTISNDIKNKIISVSGTVITLGSEATLKTMSGTGHYLPYRMLPVNMLDNNDIVSFTDPDDSNYLKEFIVVEQTNAGNYTINSTNPTKPCGSAKFNSNYLIIQYYKQNLGAFAPVYGRIVNYP